MEMAAIGFGEAQIEILDQATNFCRERSPIDKVRELMDSDTGFDAALWTEMAELGWMGIAIPEAHGGIGLSLADVVPVAEQMGRNMLASPFEFFIVVTDPGSYHLDGDYTPFGRVTSGMDVVDKINKQPVGKGDWPSQNVYIEKVEVLE